MALFTYRATNSDGKEIKGTIEATNADTATAALEDLHLEVIEVNEAMRIQRKQTTNEVSIPARQFVFEGTDVHGTTRKGSIAAKSKREAYDRLRKEQMLVPTSLSLQGTAPMQPDPDLSAWNSEFSIVSPPKVSWSMQESPPPPPAPRPPTSPPMQIIRPSKPAAQRPPIPASQRTLPSGTLDPAPSVPLPPKKQRAGYHPLISTLRLYCGWLLAWYGLFVAIGYYAHVRTLPWDIPFVESFFVSPLIFTFVVAVFLLLVLSSLHRTLKGGLFLGIFLTILWGSCTAAVRLLI